VNCTMRKGCIFLLSCLFIVPLLLSSVTFAGKTKTDEDVVAVVDGVKITKDQFFTRLLHSGGKVVLEQMIYEILLRQKAEQEGIKVSPQELEEKLKEFKQRFPTPDAMEDQLKKMGKTLEDVKRDMETQILEEKLASRDIKISEEQMKQYYERNKQFLTTREKFRAHVIQLSDEETANKVLGELKKGADFEELAKKYSIHPSKDRGGDLGLFERSTWVLDPILESTLGKMKVGDISDVVKTHKGYWILRLDERIPARQLTYGEAKDKVEKMLLKRAIATSRWQLRSQLKKEADIKILMDELK